MSIVHECVDICMYSMLCYNLITLSPTQKDAFEQSTIKKIFGYL